MGISCIKFLLQSQVTPTQTAIGPDDNGIFAPYPFHVIFPCHILPDVLVLESVLQCIEAEAI